MRLIDVDDWKSFYSDIGDSRNTMDSYDRGYTDALDRVDDWVDVQPTVEVLPVIHGHWSRYSSTMQECSNCHRHTARHKFKYCPHCGAVMEDKYNDV